MRLVVGWKVGTAALALAACLLGAGCGDTQAREPEPQVPLTLSLQTGDFLEPAPPEDVAVTLTLTNAGPAPALVNTRLLVNAPDRSHEIVFLVVGPDKKPRRFLALVNAALESGTWKVLQPGERVFTIARLGRLFDLSAKGLYSVQAVYENAQNAAPDVSSLSAWRGRVASPVVRFEVK